MFIALSDDAAISETIPMGKIRISFNPAASSEQNYELKYRCNIDINIILRPLRGAATRSTAYAAIREKAGWQPWKRSHMRLAFSKAKRQRRRCTNCSRGWCAPVCKVAARCHKRKRSAASTRTFVDKIAITQILSWPSVSKARSSAIEMNALGDKLACRFYD